MQTACSTAPSRDLDTIVLEARHLLGLADVRVKPTTIRYPRDPVTIAKVLALREESGLTRERFCERVWVGPATMWCWEQGQTGGGKPWPELAHIIRQREVAQLTAAMGVPLTPESAAVWSIPAKNPLNAPAPGPTPEWAIPTPVTGAVEAAAKRLEGLRLAPPVVGVAAEDDRPTAKSLQEQIRPIPGRVLLQHDYSAIEMMVATPIGTIPRIRGAEVTKARDEAYAAFQAAHDRMPLAEAAADLVVAYRRSHRGLEGFCRGHYDATTMAKRLAQWTAGRDEQGEQWDRLIGLLQTRGIKPSTVGLGKRAAKTGRGFLTFLHEEQTTALIRPVSGFFDLVGDFHEVEHDALASSWDTLVQRATDEILSQAARAGVTLRSFLMSDEAQKPVTDLSRALEGREAHQHAMRGQK